jgi:hypothetical protein
MQHKDSVSAEGIHFTESISSWIQACMERLAVSNVGRRHDRRQGMEMLTAIAAFFRGLFARKDDNFKALLIADLGIER